MMRLTAKLLEVMLAPIPGFYTQLPEAISHAETGS